MTSLIENGSFFLSHILGYSVFLSKVAGYLLYKPYRQESLSESVAVVVPTYNEEPELFEKCLDSVLTQTRGADEIYVVDDGSSEPRCYDMACQMRNRHPRMIVHRFHENRGKRAIHQWVVERSTSSLLVNIDSDVIAEPTALEEAIRPFSNPDVQGVSIRACAFNRDTNWLTRYLNIILFSQDFERAALSAFDSAYAPGRFCVFRSNIFRMYMKEYVSERFLGKPIRTGDDASMTRFAFREGRVVYQETSRCQTRVAERLDQFIRQFVRWERNTLRTNLKIVSEKKLLRPFWWFNNMDLFLRLLFCPAFVMGVCVTPTLALKSFGFFYVVFVLLAFRGQSHLQHTFTGWLLILVTPLLKMLQLIVATPIRYYALVTIRRDVWGSRSVAK